MSDSSAAPPGPLDQAQRRLEDALDGLVAAVRSAAHRPGASPEPAYGAPSPAPSGEADEALRRLERELEQARTRERQLEQVAAEASAALGRAAAEVRAALAAEV